MKHYDKTDSFIYSGFCISVTKKMNLRRHIKIQLTVEKTCSVIIN
jgi:hypothetical protein